MSNYASLFTLLNNSLNLLDSYCSKEPLREDQLHLIQQLVDKGATPDMPGMPRPSWNIQILNTVTYQHFTTQDWPNQDTLDTMTVIQSMSAQEALEERRTWVLIHHILRAFLIEVLHNRDIPYLFFAVSSICLTKTTPCHVRV